MNPTQFPIKFQYAVVAFVAICVAFIVGAVLFYAFLGESFNAGLLAGFLIVYSLLIWPQRLVFDGEYLRLRSGLYVVYKVRLNDISRVAPGKAWSKSQMAITKQDGLWIETGAKRRFAAVENTKAVLDFLQTACPQLHRYGSELRLDGVSETNYNERS